MPILLTEEEVPISTHSALTVFRRCPKKAEFKYIRRLVPKITSKPLKRGTWMHSLLEAYYKGEDWVEVHNRLSSQFSELFDEEKDMLGDLPRECRRLMKGYLWHYKADPWKVHEVELVLETTFPDGTIYRCRVDLLVENQYGLWLADHKNLRSLPDHDFRLLDAQSALYIWCALRNKIKVQGFIFNYLRTKAPTVPQMIQDGSRLSRRKMDTDFPTLLKAINNYGLDWHDYKSQLRYLKKQQYKHGEPQTSTFFRRDVLEKSPAMLRRVATENYHTSKRMHSYFPAPADAVERVVDRSCTWGCSYTDICTMELFGGNIEPLIKQRYKVEDPMAYYSDDKENIDRDAWQD